MRANLAYCLFFGSMLFFGSFISSQTISAEPEFSDEFGSFGTGEGKFKEPMGLALDTGSNLLYVADSDNDRIQIIDVDGNCDDNDDEYLANDVCFVDEFGENGNGDGEFRSPTALVLDTGSDLLYVADSGNDRIQIIDVDGNCGNDELANDVCFVDEFGGSGNGDGEFDLPSGLALDTATNYLYVADTNNNRIQIIDVDGNCDDNDDEYLANDVCFVDEFGGSGNGDGEFDLPSGLALHTDNDLLFIADTDNNQIQIIDVDGNCSGNAELADNICFEDEFGEVGDEEGEFKSPSGLTLDVSNDMLYVADTDNERIQIIDVDGNCSGSDELADDICFEDEFGQFGDDDGEFDVPSALVLDTGDDLLYVADTDNNRIQVLELSESSSSSSGSPSRPTNLEAFPISTTSIFLTWDVSDPDEDVTGYKIEAREGSDNFETLASNTGSNANSFVHGGLSSETYTYRIYAINDKGTSSVSSTVSEKPEDSLAPAALTAVAISDSKIKLSWFPPTSTFGQSISGYTIERIITTGVYDEVGTTGSATTTFTVSNLETDKAYSYVVKAKFSQGGSPRSNTASATPTEDSVEPASSSITVPSSPKLTAKVISETQINLSWTKPSDGGSSISGYKIEVQEDSDSYSVLVENTKSTSTTYSHTNLTTDTKYTYKVSAINGIGAGSSSNESSGTPTEAPTQVLEIKSLSKKTTDEGKRLAFIVGITDSSIDNVRFSLASNAPSGASISSSGSFTWTPSNTQSGSYTFDVIAKTSSLEDRASISITVNDVVESKPDEPKEKTDEPKELGIASFVDKSKDPQSYVDRYNNEPTYKEWFDENFSEYDSIYQAVGLDEELIIPAPFVDKSKDPQSYVDRYNNEPTYKEWFDENFSEYDSIYQAVGIEETKPVAAFVDPSQDPQYYVDRYNNEPLYAEWFDENFPEYDSIQEAVGLDESEVKEPEIGECGPGTELIDGKCELTDQPEGGGCLIATAAYGSEMAPQVQFLREIRDGKVMSTESGASFMTGFNQFYYSFSPVIADYERENPVFKEAVRMFITPMISTLSIMTLAEDGNDAQILGLGMSVIALNLGMYIAAPAIVVYGIKKVKLVKF
jgi:sugar lactone lactonase YvrE